MIIRALTLSLAIACSLAACTSPGAPTPEPRPDLDQIANEEAAALAVEQILEPTPEMLAAALTEDPEAMREAAATSNSCQQPVTCPTSYGSCTAWSAPSQCNFSCTPSYFCACPGPEHPDNPPCEPPYEVSMGRTTSTSYRVCFNAQAQACTEIKWQVNTYCGC